MSGGKRPKTMYLQESGSGLCENLRIQKFKEFGKNQNTKQ
jgi:hypothetical protein